MAKHFQVHLTYGKILIFKKMNPFKSSIDIKYNHKRYELYTDLLNVLLWYRTKVTTKHDSITRNPSKKNHATILKLLWLLQILKKKSKRFFNKTYQHKTSTLRLPKNPIKVLNLATPNNAYAATLLFQIVFPQVSHKCISYQVRI